MLGHKTWKMIEIGVGTKEKCQNDFKKSKNYSYKEKLENLELTSAPKRKMGTNLIETFKISIAISNFSR